jgi:hypothetical protein
MVGDRRHSHGADGDCPRAEGEAEAVTRSTGLRIVGIQALFDVCLGVLLHVAWLFLLGLVVILGCGVTLFLDSLRERE